MKDYIKRALETMADQDFILDRLYTDDNHSQIKSTSRMQLINGVIGLQDEAGEISGAVKKHIEYGQLLDKTNLKEEVGDAFWRLAQICDAVGLTFEECMEANLSKLQGKKGRYEKGYSEEAAKEENRDRAAERKILEQQLDKCGITPLNPEPIESYQRSTQVPLEDQPMADPGRTDTIVHSLCSHSMVDFGGQQLRGGTMVGTCMQCGKQIEKEVWGVGTLPTKDPYIQTGAGWAEPAKVYESSGTISIATLREWAALVDNNIPDCKLSNQIKQAALNQGIALHLIQACSSWSEVVDLMEKEKKPQHRIYCNYQNGPIGAPGCVCLKPLPKPFIESSGFVLARRIADTYVEGQNKARALAEIARAEEQFKVSK